MKTPGLRTLLWGHTHPQSTDLNSSWMAGSTGTAGRGNRQQCVMYHSTRFHRTFLRGVAGSGHHAPSNSFCSRKVTRGASRESGSVDVPRTPLDRVRCRFSSASTSIWGESSRRSVSSSHTPRPAGVRCALVCQGQFEQCPSVQGASPGEAPGHAKV